MGKISDFFKKKILGKEKEETKKQDVEKEEIEISDENVIKIVDFIINNPGIIESILKWKSYRNGEISREEVGKITSPEMESKLDRFLTFLNSKNVKPLVDEILEEAYPFMKEHPEDNRTEMNMYSIRMQEFNRKQSEYKDEGEKLEEYKKIVEEFCFGVKIAKSVYESNEFTKKLEKEMELKNKKTLERLNREQEEFERIQRAGYKDDLEDHIRINIAFEEMMREEKRKKEWMNKYNDSSVGKSEDSEGQDR